MSLYDDVFAALSRAGVRYVVVGGTAVVLRGVVRSTVDLDLVIDLEREAATAAMRVLVGLGLVPRAPVDATEFADPEARREWSEVKNMQVFSFFDPHHPLREIDVFLRYPMDFELLVASAAPVDVNGTAVPVAAREHLIAMKRAVGRPQDLLDADALEQLGPADE